MAKYTIQHYGTAKKIENPDIKAIRTLISSHAETHRSAGRINDKLDELLTLIKAADGVDTTSNTSSNTSDSKLLQRVNNIEGQNRQILDALAMLTNYLKRLK